MPPWPLVLSACSVNVETGVAEDRQMVIFFTFRLCSQLNANYSMKTTGLHTVVDVHCRNCNHVLGWKYVRLIVSYCLSLSFFFLFFYFVCVCVRTIIYPGKGLWGNSKVQGGQVHSWNGARSRPPNVAVCLWPVSHYQICAIEPKRG